MTEQKKVFVPATVNGIPEPVFRERWIAMLWRAMAATGKGYRRHSLRHTGRQQKDGTWDRRADKLEGSTKLDRHLLARCQVA